jgi:hypothetical protein
MGIESSLANFMRDKEEYIKNSSNPRKARRAMESSFRRMVKDGTVVLLPKGGFTTSKEFDKGFTERYGTPEDPSDLTIAMAKRRSEQLGRGDWGTGENIDPGKSISGKGLSYFPTGRKKGGKIKAKASKYAKGGGVRKSKYSL